MGELLDLKALIERAPPKAGQVRFVAVDGRGASGKSSFARALAENVGAEIVAIDDFASWDNPTNWWPAIIEKVFTPAAEGAKRLSYPRTEWWDEQAPERIVDQKVTPIMLLEGVGSSRKELRDYLSFSIFIDTPVEECLSRGVDRDRLLTGKRRSELTKLWKGWFEGEEAYFKRDNPKAFANIVLDGTRPFADQVKF